MAMAQTAPIKDMAMAQIAPILDMLLTQSEPNKGMGFDTLVIKGKGLDTNGTHKEYGF